MPKEDCKYWDKCYQRNQEHLQKYNHPEKPDARAEQPKPKETHKRKLSRDSRNSKDSNPEQNTPDGDAAMQNEPPFETDKLRDEALANISGKNWMEMLQKRIKLSEQQEYDNLLKTNEFIRHKFLVEMPPDFYAFWKFLEEIKKDVSSGEQILQFIEKQFQLQLVGPFEFMAGRFHDAKLHEPGDYLRHWRFYYDPPEFQSIFVRRDTGIHYGYWRDEPSENGNLLIARNDANKSCEFEFIAGNAFEAFLYYLDKDFPSNPFAAATVATTKKALNNFLEAKKVELSKLETLRKARTPKVVSKSLHRAGIVVPFDRKTELGYRPLMVSDTELKKILKLFEVANNEDEQDESVKKVVIEKLQPIATAANIAMDECDFGTSLELGIDLFSSGRTELHMLVQSLLVPAYTMLHRPQYIAISKAHMEKRSKTNKLSIFDLDQTK